MLVTRKNIIDAALKISRMNSESIEALALKLLDSNPTIVLRALEIGVAQKLYKVAITNRNASTHKINVIKTFRCVTGAGLADAKAWAEGKECMGRPSGVFGHSLNRVEADELLRKVNSDIGSATGVVIEVIPNDDPVTPLPYSWGGGW